MSRCPGSISVSSDGQATCGWPGVHPAHEIAAEPDFTRADAIGDITRYLEQAKHVFKRYKARYGDDEPRDPMADLVGPAAMAVRILCARADVESALRMLREAATFLDHPGGSAGEAGARLQPSGRPRTDGGSPGGVAASSGAGDSFTLPDTPRIPAFKRCTCAFCRPRVSG